jgi:tetratricopeptide (TPR) repeat protein
VLGQCLLKEGKLDEAEAIARENVDFSHRVYDKDHINREFYLGLLGHVLMVRGKWDEAEALFKEALDASPSNSRYWQQLGDLNARRGDWKSAVQQLTRTVELEPGEDGNRGSLSLAVALVQAGQLNEYRQHCHQFLERNRDTHEFGDADKAAKAGLFLPVDGADLDLACKLADFSATATEPKSFIGWAQFCKALAEYRRGHFDSAIDWAARAIASSIEENAPAQAADYFIQAGAYAHLQQIESSRAALAKGDEFVQQARQQISGDFIGSWPEWAIADHLRQEAEKSLSDKPAAEAKSKKRN